MTVPCTILFSWYVNSFLSSNMAKIVLPIHWYGQLICSKLGVMVGLEHFRFDGFCNRRLRHYVF